MYENLKDMSLKESQAIEIYNRSLAKEKGLWASVSKGKEDNRKMGGGNIW